MTTRFTCIDGGPHRRTLQPPPRRTSILPDVAVLRNTDRVGHRGRVHLRQGTTRRRMMITGLAHSGPLLQTEVYQEYPTGDQFELSVSSSVLVVASPPTNRCMPWRVVYLMIDSGGHRGDRPGGGCGCPKCDLSVEKARVDEAVRRRHVYLHRPDRRDMDGVSLPD